MDKTYGRVRREGCPGESMNEKEFFQLIRRALIMVIVAIEKRYEIDSKFDEAWLIAAGFKKQK